MSTSGYAKSMDAIPRWWWASKERSWTPVDASHMRRDLSPDAEMTKLPESATALTAARWDPRISNARGFGVGEEERAAAMPPGNRQMRTAWSFEQETSL